jgi:hypothetical protein
MNVISLIIQLPKFKTVYKGWNKMKLTINEIINILQTHSVDYKIITENETIGIHVNEFGDGSQWNFYSFNSIDTIKKIKNFLQY